MQALFTTEDVKTPLQWRDTDRPQLELATDAIVQPLAVAACDLDRSICSGNSPFPGEFVLGHEFTGEVVSVGCDVEHLAVGDVVLASFQPSCGSCARCRRHHSSVCSSVPNGTMYGIGQTGGGWGGAFAEQIRVPWADYNLTGLTGQVDPAILASASDNLADGLRGVDGPLERLPGATVLVAGRGSIPLYAVLCADFLGAGDIAVASDDAFVLETAEQMGADCFAVEAWPKRFKSFDVTVDCTNSRQGLSAVLQSTAPYGECTSSSIFFGGAVDIPLFNLNMRGITFHTGRVNSAADIPRVLELISQGLNPDNINPAYCSFETVVETLHDEPFSRKVIAERELRYGATG